MLPGRAVDETVGHTGHTVSSRENRQTGTMADRSHKRRGAARASR